MTHFSLNESVKFIIDCCCEACGVTVEDFYSKCRKKDMVLARYMAMKFISDNIKMTKKDIGRRLSPDEPMDHTTVIHGLKTVNQEIVNQNERTVMVYNDICRKINSELKLNFGGTLMVYFPKDFDIHAVVREFNLKHKNLEFQFM